MGSNVIAHLLRKLEFVIKRSRNKCATTGLNTQFLARDIISLALWEEGVRRTGEGLVGRQEVQKFGGQANISNEDLNTPTISNLNVISLPSFPQNFRSSDCYPPLPSLIREGVSSRHPELVSGSFRQINLCVSATYENPKQVRDDMFSFPKRAYSLINLFSYSLKKRAAFTLAEVLITLGVIGIVAAMTMPTLIANYREKVFVTSAKRGYSVLTNAINKWNADNGVVGDPTYFWLSGTEDELIVELSKVLNSVKVCTNHKVNDCGGRYDILQYKKMNNGKGETANENWISNNSRIILADGTFISLQRSSGDNCYKRSWINTKDENGYYIEDPDSPTGFAGKYGDDHTCGRLAYDTNGLKGPNQVGVDVFQIPYYSDGTIGTTNNGWGNIDYVLTYNKLIKTEKYTPGKFSE